MKHLIKDFNNVNLIKVSKNNCSQYFCRNYLY